MPALRTALIVASVAASETSGTATEEISAECVGEDCNLLENLPCRQEHRFDIGFAG